MRTFNNRSLITFIACLSILCVAFSAWLPFRNLTWDEPHIFYHYARNFASGHGLVFNRDERILGFTSPLFQCVLAVCALFTLELPYLGNLLFALSLAGFSIVVFLALRRINLGFLGFITAISLIIWPVPYDYMGMETLILAFFVFSSFYFFVGGRFILSVIFISLAILTRYDSVIPAGLLLIMYIVEERRCPWKFLGIAALILIPWFAFSLLYYGVVLPQTFYAKKDMLSLSGFVTGTLWEHGFLFNVMRSQKDLPLPWFVLPVLGIIFGIRKSRYFALIFFYMLGIAMGYTLTARVEEPWPIFPVIAGMRIFLFYGIHQVATFCSLLFRAKKWSRLVYIVVLLVLTAPVLLQDFSLLKKKPGSKFIQHLFVARMKAYEEAGNWLKENADPSSTVYTAEPGTLAYYSGCIFFDYYGLVTQRGCGVPWEEVGRSIRPDYVVLPDGYLGQGSNAPPGYEVVRVFESPPYPPVRISQRRDLMGGRTDRIRGKGIRGNSIRRN